MKEKIDKMNKTTLEINNELHKSHYLTKSIKSSWGLFKSLFTKPKSEKEEDYVTDTSSGSKGNSESLSPVGPVSAQLQARAPMKTNQSETDDLLDELLDESKKLKKGAILIGESIDRSNTKLEHLNKNVDKTVKNLDKVDKELAKCLRK